MLRRKMRYNNTYSNIRGSLIKTLVISCGMIAMTGMLAGCGKKDEPEVETVQLSIWADERMVPLLEEGIAEFQDLHKDEVVLEYTISEEGEDTCRDTVLADPEHAADIFSFADDQFDDLYKNDALLEISEDVDQIIDANGGKDSTVAQVVTVDGKVYAYPQTAGNGYFLYYNKKYFSDNDIKNLDTILDIAADNDKKFTMEYGNGWYIYSFFKGAGLELNINEEGSANECNWNATDTRYKGTDVAEAMLKIAAHKGFVTLADDEFVEGVKDGTVIAGINGAWNSSYIKEAWGDDYAAAQLPSYTIGSDSVQMSSFTGYKLMGISRYTDNPEWSMKLAEYLTNEQNQLKRFELLGECPVNTKAAQSEEVSKNPAVAALAEQAPYASIQRIASPYWDAAAKFGVTIAGGNSGDRDLQELLDATVEEIIKPAE